MSAMDTLDNFYLCAQLGGAPGEDRLALDNRNLWPNGSEIVVNMWGIISQSDFVRSKVIQYANEWSLYANLTFKFMDRDAPGDSDIRISFTSGAGSWSQIGTAAKSVPQSEPTMNFGWFNDESTEEVFRRTVIHEFGHAIGCIHEQASPVADIPWNKPAVYEYYLRTNGWNQARVDGNIFAKRAQAITLNTNWDKTSIMQYAYPAELTLDGSSVGWNTVLSNLDKTFVMRCYPRDGIVRNTQDGVYLVNRVRGNQRASGVAYYANFGNNNGQGPDDYVEVSNDDYAWWENGGQVTFGSGAHVRAVVKWNLADDAGRSPLFTRVGFAEKSGEKWNVYRDDGRVLYERDGWQVQAMFWAF
ncbi:zincin [Amniculicola lignicola CBS 123094]|uniref:Zincin n=1 Tax=Amniculicola lignicola CBS 123094 TaxID=1392246 RepID=A0A6A5WLL6_9PLEO|nr:zincin [Amniculicola lignicola CBS 123094]